VLILTTTTFVNFRSLRENLTQFVTCTARIPRQMASTNTLSSVQALSLRRILCLPVTHPIKNGPMSLSLLGS